MTPFTRVAGVAFALIEDDVNTDQIAPLSMARVLHPDYADLLFKRRRVDAAGKRLESHPLNQTRYKEVAVFVGGHNFGCGSGREAAVWCLAAIGVRCVIARSFSDLFRENCLQGGVLPITLESSDAERVERAVIDADGLGSFEVDLVSSTIAGPNGLSIRFQIPEFDRVRLLEGLDEIGCTLKHEAEILAWEETARRCHPWMQKLRDRRSDRAREEESA